MGRDVHADAIVRSAKDSHVPLGDRAVEAVKSIVREYYDESMLSDVVYDENEGGLSTTPVEGAPWIMHPGTPKAHIMFAPRM